jgi:hypothetical protein
MLGRTMEAAAVAAGLALASAGALADGERLYFEVSNALSPGQPTATVTLWTAFDPRDYCFGAVRTEAIASDGQWSDPRLIPPMIAGGASPGVVSADGLRVEGVLPGQFHFPFEYYGDPSNPIALWQAEITVTDFTPRAIMLSTETDRYMVHPFRDQATGRDVADVAEAAAAIAVVPAPASLGVLAMGAGLAGARRRRG